MSFYCVVKLILLGDISKPAESQIIAAADPDLTPEQWRQLGQSLIDTMGKNDMNKILVGEDENSVPTFANVEDPPTQ